MSSKGEGVEFGGVELLVIEDLPGHIEGIIFMEDLVVAPTGLGRTGWLAKTRSPAGGSSWVLRNPMVHSSPWPRWKSKWSPEYLSRVGSPSGVRGTCRESK